MADRRLVGHQVQRLFVYGSSSEITTFVFGIAWRKQASGQISNTTIPMIQLPPGWPEGVSFYEEAEYAAPVACILTDKTLPSGHVYVGQGHHSHRLPVTKWASPFVPGHSCSGSDWLPLYVEHIIQHFEADSHELCGCVLACDCPLEATCEADVLAGLAFEECRAAPPQREPTRRGRRRGNLSGPVR